MAFMGVSEKDLIREVKEQLLPPDGLEGMLRRIVREEIAALRDGYAMQISVVKKDSNEPT